MRLAIKFNLILAFISALCLGVAGVISFKVLEEHSDHEVIEHARMMMESAKAVRGYTIQEIRPLLQTLGDEEFLPQTVPSYAATQNFKTVQKDNPEYSYKEAVLNPTNPRDKATDWENDIITQFRNHSDLKEIIGERETPTGTSLYLARPIRITNKDCLTCHSTVDQAPASMIKLYGPANGFGWQHNEIVGSQIISVPAWVAKEKAWRAFTTFMITLTAIFFVFAIAINLMIRSMITSKISKMIELADQVSKGDTNAPDFDLSGNDEMAELSHSFQRLRISLSKAMKMLE
ncbi:MAG: DUF3365 domain-containing protein [Cellvibrionaceae bacterium]